MSDIPLIQPPPTKAPQEVTTQYLRFAQYKLNPFPLASSGLPWGHCNVAWPIRILRFDAVIYVGVTNNATNYWTIKVADVAGNIFISFNTSTFAVNTSIRVLSAPILQPAGTITFMYIMPTATLAPGAIYVMPILSILRQG